ncbi:MAG: hypothetical protein E7578_03000 [Ruminococcaceae bacterium]|nr:hypothetical protein [Oscillospiraceae bacterium]
MDKKDMQKTEDCRLCIPHINQSTITECGEEFTLPDYYPEIKRVVSTLCRVLPESWYDSGETVEQGGVVCFTVVYLGDDGSLTAAPLTCDFTAMVQTLRNADGEGTVISVETSAENVTCRCAGPRKLSLRARLRTTVTGDRLISAETQVTDTAGEEATVAEKISVQTLESAVQTMRRSTGKLTGSVSGELRERAGTRPVMCDGEIMVNEALLDGNAVTLRGDAVMWCILFGDDGLYYKTTAKVPFEEKIPLTGEKLSGGSARGFGRCASVSVKDSDDGTLLWDMEYDLECEAAENTFIGVAKDMYSTLCECEDHKGTVDSLSMLKCHTGRLSLSGDGKGSGKRTPGDYIIGSFGKAFSDKLERDGTHLTLTGTAEVHVLVCGGGEVVEECIKLPIKYECDCPETGMGELFRRCDLTVTDSTARLEGDNIRVTAEVCVSLFAGLSQPVTYVTKLELDRSTKSEDRGSMLRIYYPAEGETPWDITKKYRIPKNAVTEVTTSGVLIE